MISNIKENGVYLEIAKQEIITNYKDDKFVSRELGDVISNKDSIIKITIILDIIYSVICLVMIIVFSKILSKPIIKLISDAEKMVSDENKMEKQKNKDSDEVVNAFNMMTEELKENLNEMTRQKKQIETMILHMTDGIIAFNIQGEVILVNPAATRFEIASISDLYGLASIVNGKKDVAKSDIFLL